MIVIDKKNTKNEQEFKHNETKNKKTLKNKTLFIIIGIVFSLTLISGIIVGSVILLKPEKIKLSCLPKTKNYDTYLHFDVTYSNPTYIENKDKYYTTATIYVTSKDPKYTFEDCSLILYISEVGWGSMEKIQLQLNNDGTALGTITIEHSSYPLTTDSNNKEIMVEEISGYVYK